VGKHLVTRSTAGITDLNPEGLTSATGKWAGQVASRLKVSPLVHDSRSGVEEIGKGVGGAKRSTCGWTTVGDEWEG
jgi:hypothetical protein